VQLDKILFGQWDLVDETMSAFRPRTTQTGGLPNISFILWKPEPLGTKFRDTAYGIIRGALKHLELQQGKRLMGDKEYCKKGGNSSAHFEDVQSRAPKHRGGRKFRYQGRCVVW